MTPTIDVLTRLRDRVAGAHSGISRSVYNELLNLIDAEIARARGEACEQSTDTPLVLREGGYYRRRDGKVVGPIRPSTELSAYPWYANGSTYTTDGQMVAGEYHDRDLIAEVPAPTAPSAPEPMQLREGKPVDCDKSRDGKHAYVGGWVGEPDDVRKCWHCSKPAPQSEKAPEPRAWPSALKWWEECDFQEALSVFIDNELIPHIQAELAALRKRVEGE